MPAYTGHHTPYDSEGYAEMIDRLWAPQIAPHRRVIAAGKDVTTEPVDTWPDYARNAYLQGWRPRYYEHETPAAPPAAG